MNAWIGTLRVNRGLSSRCVIRQVLPTNFLHNRRLSMATPTQTTLDFKAGPLVWIDCEMTGLNSRTDKILEIAVLVTNGDLEVMDSGIEFVIKTEKDILDRMDEWCVEQHGKSGLTQACLESPYTREVVKKSVLDYIQKWIPTRNIGVLAGNSVHADRMFLAEEMPELLDWLHYRIVDVSSIKELSRRWFSQRGIPPKIVEFNHRAMGDIKGSIQELKWYRKNIFVPSFALQASESPSRPNSPK